ncbi:MAG TPA: hypothetical protein VMQ83_04445 [Gammaproteobacteria bacterium]|nr:hypothetical protein [Gammaproteobacteria bacterium]
MTPAEVLNLGDGHESAAGGVLGRYGLELRLVADGAPLPGSWWGGREAGLQGRALYARADTPLHSVLHEACHFACMTPARRAALDTDAGGDYDEENGVCYLQVILAGELPGFGRERMLADMDTWGYSFRLGSARAWFEQDAADARAWLLGYGLIDTRDRPTWRLRAA